MYWLQLIDKATSFEQFGGEVSQAADLVLALVIDKGYF